jgi:hypothetical protein
LGGSSVDERGVLFFEDPFFVERMEGGRFRGGIFGGESGWGVGLQRSERETFGKKKERRKKVSKGGA